jgi:hypothetical protein
LKSFKIVPYPYRTLFVQSASIFRPKVSKECLQFWKKGPVTG